MEIRHKVKRFPGPAFVAILGLAAGLVAVITLAVGGWGLSIGSPANSGTTRQTQPTIQIQQPAATPQPCVGSLSECSS